MIVAAGQNLFKPSNHPKLPNHVWCTVPQGKWTKSKPKIVIFCQNIFILHIIAKNELFDLPYYAKI